VQGITAGNRRKRAAAALWREEAQDNSVGTHHEVPDKRHPQQGNCEIVLQMLKEPPDSVKTDLERKTHSAFSWSLSRYTLLAATASPPEANAFEPYQSQQANE
jgi:hypothetical protein